MELFTPHGKQNLRLHKACRRHLCRRRQGQYPQRDPLCYPPASGAEGNTSDEVTKQISEMPAVLATIIITIVLVQVVGCDEKESQKN